MNGDLIVKDLHVSVEGKEILKGISLTVNAVEDQGPEGGDTTHFSVNLIPHTQAVTTLGALAQGQAVNIEIDVLARCGVRQYRRHAGTHRQLATGAGYLFTDRRKADMDTGDVGDGVEWSGREHAGRDTELAQPRPLGRRPGAHIDGHQAEY